MTRRVEALAFLNGIERLEVDRTPGHCFVAHQYSGEEIDDYREFLAAGLRPEYEPLYVDDIEPKHILHQICGQILSTDFGIYDISHVDNPGVFIELGLAIGFNKPAIITKRGGTPTPDVMSALDTLDWDSYLALRDGIRIQTEHYVHGVSTPALHPAHCAICDKTCEARKLTVSSRTYFIADQSPTEDIRLTIQEALAASGLELLDHSVVISGSKICALCECVQKAWLGIYNISEPWSPSVFLQLGIAIASGQPWLLVMRKGCRIPPDLAGFQRIEFKSITWLRRTLKNRASELVASIHRAQRESDALRGLPSSIDEILRACQLQVENEIMGAIGGKYVPALYIDRSAQEQLDKFIAKSPADAVRHIHSAFSAADGQREAIRARQAQVKQPAFSTIHDRGRDLTAREKSQIESLEQELRQVSALKPLLEQLESALQADRAEVDQVRAILNQVDAHSGCVGDIRIHLDQVKHCLKNCLVITDMAGRGKTNLVCALASKWVKYQPTVLVAGGTVRLEDKFDLERYIRASLGYSRNTSIHRFMDRLARLAASAGTEILVIIDAVNENRDTALVKSAIQSLVSRYNDQYFKFVVTCRDIYWDGFLHLSGDFWDKYTFDQLQLGDFTPDEFARVLPLYFRKFRIKASLSARAADKLRHPLLLRFFCEAYRVPGKTVDLGEIKDIRLKHLFDVYWKNKIEAVRTRLAHRTPRAVDTFLLLIARKMRFNRDRTLSFNDITKMTDLADFESADSLYTRILDEGIILEQTPSGLDGWHEPRASFVYDEFMEYAMARDLMLNTMNTDDRRRLHLRLKRVLKSAHRFSSIYGVVAYLLPMLEAERAYNGWALAYSQGDEWHLTLCAALSKMLLQELSPNALAIANRLAETGDESVRWEITQLLHDLHKVRPDDAIPLWCTLVQDSLADLRLEARYALVTLARAGYPAAREGLARALEHPHPTVRGTAAYALAELGDLDINQLRRLVQDTDGYVREAVIYSVGRAWDHISKEIGKEALVRGLSDPVPEVRAMAARVIRETGESGLWPLLSDARANENIGFVQQIMDEVLHSEYKKGHVIPILVRYHDADHESAPLEPR